MFSSMIYNSPVKTCSIFKALLRLKNGGCQVAKRDYMEGTIDIITHINLANNATRARISKNMDRVCIHAMITREHVLSLKRLSEAWWW